MEFVRLGRSGLKVSKICLGTMTFGREADEQTSFQIMDRYMELGGSFLDTADQYSFGISEEVVGRWIKARGVRNQVILATKVYQQMSPGPNDGFLSRYHILQACDASLRRLADRCHRSVPDPSLGSRDAAGGDAGSAERPGAPGQGALHRLLEPQSLAPGPIPEPLGTPALVSLGVHAAHL